VAAVTPMIVAAIPVRASQVVILIPPAR